MISIITAIHNGLAFNKIYMEYLNKYTYNQFELIIIDNCSNDGSTDFFKNSGAVVIENKVNYSYPVCQNQGIRIAKGEYLFFLNNDIILSPEWDKKLIEIAKQHQIDIISASGVENMGSAKATQTISRKWKRTKNPLSVFGFSGFNLRLMHKLMYGNWERFCNKLFNKYKHQVVEGIVGNNVMMTKRAIAIVGEWDERLQMADFDLFMRTKKRYLEQHDIKPCHIAMGVYIHHFVRMTIKYAVKPIPFADKNNIIPLQGKWSAEEIENLHPDNETLRK